MDKIEKIEYFWGMFDSPEKANASEAGKYVCLGAPEIPEDVKRSFKQERIMELKGEFGLPGAGKPEEIDSLKVSVEGQKWEIRVFNRGIALFTAETDELLRLHRFFCVLQS